MASFYFTQEGARIVVHIKSDVSINAWQGGIFLPGGVGEVKINSASGITDVWQQAPMREGNRIVFTGGKMNGFTGDGVLFDFSLQSGTYALRFLSETSAYLNDGLGTKVVSQFPQPRFIAEVTQDMFAGIAVDGTPPEPFTLTRYQQNGFFDDKPVVIFEARDLQSGVSHYEVREITDSGVVDWHSAQSPYVVHEDVRRIEVKAVDYFGNERVEALNMREFSPTGLFTIAAILSVLVVYTIRRWRKSRKKHL